MNLAFPRKLFFFLCILAGHLCQEMLQYNCSPPARMPVQSSLSSQMPRKGRVALKNKELWHTRFLEQPFGQAADLIHTNKSWPQRRTISFSNPILTIRIRRSHPHHPISPSARRICNSTDSSNDPQIASEETVPDRSDFLSRTHKTRRSCFSHRSL